MNGYFRLILIGVVEVLQTRSAIHVLDRVSNITRNDISCNHRGEFNRRDFHDDN